MKKHLFFPYNIYKKIILKEYRILIGCVLLLVCSVLTGCGKDYPSDLDSSEDSFETGEFSPSAAETIPDTPVPSATPEYPSGTRDNTPLCLVPEAPGTTVYGTSEITLDASHTGNGYLCVRYTGSCPKVKLQITGSDDVTYTYNLSGNDFEVFPLTAGDGIYQVGVYENIAGKEYATAFYQELSVTLENAFAPFLYPNQYVNFHPESQTVAKAQELAASADTDLDVISNVYNYVISSIRYDYEKAANVASGYICDVDETLSTGKGICLDYAALMASMLRSQGIPTHLEIGYAKEAYHAWISAYVDEKGWVNGIIKFDGKNWSLMDPTFAANSSEDSLKKFIGDGSNYTVKYVY